MSSRISVVEFDMYSLFLHGFSYLFHVIVITLSDSKRNLRTELHHQIKLYNLYNSFLTIKAKLYENWVVNVLFCFLFLLMPIGLDTPLPMKLVLYLCNTILLLY